jgi:hypothetical protein
VTLLITAVLSIRFSFTNVATYTVLEFVGSSLPDGNSAPCGNMYARFIQDGPTATKFDMCVQECVVYRDAHRLSDPIREFHLLDATTCPACMTPRLDPVTGKPAHVPAHAHTSSCLSLLLLITFALSLVLSLNFAQSPHTLLHF